MPKDTVTLALSGEVSLGDFAIAMERFNGLLNELVRTGKHSFTWVVADLEVGSAIATARAIPRSEDDIEAVDSVVDQFINVGRALANDQLTTLSPKVAEHARHLARLINGAVESVRFETADSDVIVHAAPVRGRDSNVAEMAPRAAYGSIEGRVQTLTNRGGLRFTLYESTNDKAVSCYLATGDEETLRHVWGKLVRVDGMVYRDPASDRPMTVRQISKLITLPDTEMWDFRRARAIAAIHHDEPLPEVLIRRVRDAW